MESGATLDNGQVVLVVSLDAEGGAGLRCGPVGTEIEPSSVPIADLRVDGDGDGWVGTRATGSTVGARLRAVDVRQHKDGLHVHQVDPATGLDVVTILTPVQGAAAFRAVTEVRNSSPVPVRLRAVTSLVLGGIGPPGRGVDRVDIIRGRSDWLGENRWRRERIRRAGLVDLYRGAPASAAVRPRGAIRAGSASSWSTGEDLPVGAVVDTATGAAWMWQVEHQGPWSWQVGEVPDGLYLALSGPDDAAHQWSHELLPGATFTTVPVTVAVSNQCFEGVVAELTAARRASRSVRDPHLPVVFNDFMNTLMGDPTAERLLPLVDAAADVGADVFVIDAGWYDDGEAWWHSVGEWQPSARRFPDGLGAVLDRIRGLGMTPGLWWEPEVVGPDSPVATSLPSEAFLSLGGHRYTEGDRFHLDLAHPAARAHLDAVVDRLVGEWGVGYLKLDYNMRAGVGTDRDATSAGAGLLRHHRAHLDWIDGVRQRYPSLLLENCASGAMRQDYALLRRHDLQSTSDQEVPELYPPIAAGAAVSVAPDQAANWAYPQPTMSHEQIIFTLVTGLAGRLYLSGFLDTMTPDQRSLVRQAVDFHRRRRDLLRRGRPSWPLGLPDWDDTWIASALFDPVDATCELNVWRREGARSTVWLHLPAAPHGQRWQSARQVFPIGHDDARWTIELDVTGEWLVVGCANDIVSARVITVTSTSRVDPYDHP